MEAFLPGEGMGGAGNHWNGQSWRWAEYDPILRTRLESRYGKNAIPPELTLQDWGVTAARLLYLHVAQRSSSQYPATAVATPWLRPTARTHASRSSSVVSITGIAFGWIGLTVAFGAIVKKPYTDDGPVSPSTSCHDRP
jgi:hypothetical protein